MDNYVCIITGPIGSGKSFVLNLIDNYDFQTLDLDKVSNNILESSEGINYVKKEFVEAMEGSKINRTKLANIVFLDNAKLRILESFLHPRVLNYYNDWASNLRGYGFVEVSAPKRKIQGAKTLVVKANKDIRIKRLLKRGMSLNDIENRISVQPDEEWWDSLGEVVENVDRDKVKNDLDETFKRWRWID